MYSLVIVDDETYILELLGSVFRWDEMGFSLEGSFAGAKDALGYLRGRKTDVLLTDIQLGPDSGLELAAEARRMWPDVCIVILSAHSDFKYAHTALRISVYDYLLKPVTKQGIAECFGGLRQALDARRAAGGAGRAGGADGLERIGGAGMAGMAVGAGGIEGSVGAGGARGAGGAGGPGGARHADLGGGRSGDYRIILVKKYIDKHVGEDITLEGMADSVAMNAAYFSRFFKRHTGEHFAEYLAKRRMEKAIELLRDPRYKVFEISPMVGYFSKQNFYRRFRQHTGRTPIEYRNEVLMIQDDDE